MQDQDGTGAAHLPWQSQWPLSDGSPAFFFLGGGRISEAISSHQKYLSHPQALAGITETGKKRGGCLLVLLC